MHVAERNILILFIHCLLMMVLWGVSNYQSIAMSLNSVEWHNYLERFKDMAKDIMNLIDFIEYSILYPDVDGVKFYFMRLRFLLKKLCKLRHLTFTKDKQKCASRVLLKKTLHLIPSNWSFEWQMCLINRL